MPGAVHDGPDVPLTGQVETSPSGRIPAVKRKLKKYVKEKPVKFDVNRLEYDRKNPWGEQVVDRDGKILKPGTVEFLQEVGERQKVTEETLKKMN